MTTPAELAVRVLRKLKVIGATETASAEDLQLATEGIHEAHQVLKNQSLAEWTLQDIPQEVELSYALMGAYLKADDFVQPKDAGWMATGIANVQAFVHVPYTGESAAADF
jgi:hypothetical protein